jgi:hypothetical protein
VTAEPPATGAGTCIDCGERWQEAPIVADIDSNSGAGATLVRCPHGCGAVTPARRRVADLSLPARRIRGPW